MITRQYLLHWIFLTLDYTLKLDILNENLSSNLKHSKTTLGVSAFINIFQFYILYMWFYTVDFKFLYLYLTRKR